MQRLNLRVETGTPNNVGNPYTWRSAWSRMTTDQAGSETHALLKTGSKTMVINLWPSDTDRQALNTTAHPARYRLFSKDGWHNIFHPVLCLVTHPCLTLCNPWTGSPPGSSVYGDSPGKNTGVGCPALLQGIFPTQGSNPGLPHCRWILYHLSHQENPRKLE